MPSNPKRYTTGYTGIKAKDVADYLHRDFTPDEKTLATSLITAAEFEIADRCNRQFAVYDSSGQQIVYEEYFSADDVLFPAAFPVSTISEISVDGSVLTLVNNSDYYLDDVSIVFDQYQPPRGLSKRGVKVLYTIEKFWGDDVVLLVKKMAAQAFLSSEDGGIRQTEQSFSSIRRVFDNSSNDREIDAVINRYRKRLL